MKYAFLCRSAVTQRYDCACCVRSVIARRLRSLAKKACLFTSMVKLGSSRRQYFAFSIRTELRCWSETRYFIQHLLYAD